MTDMINYARDDDNYERVYTISQALKLCLDKKGKIDIGYISELTNIENIHSRYRRYIFHAARYLIEPAAVFYAQSLHSRRYCKTNSTRSS